MQLTSGGTFGHLLFNGTRLRDLASAAVFWALKSLQSKVPTIKNKLLLYPTVLGPSEPVMI